MLYTGRMGPERTHHSQEPLLGNRCTQTASKSIKPTVTFKKGQEQKPALFQGTNILTFLSLSLFSWSEFLATWQVLFDSLFRWASSVGSCHPVATILFHKWKTGHGETVSPHGSWLRGRIANFCVARQNCNRIGQRGKSTDTIRTTSPPPAHRKSRGQKEEQAKGVFCKY